MSETAIFTGGCLCGDVRYQGAPKVTKKVAGSGSVRPAGPAS